MTFLISLVITVLGLVGSWGAYQRKGLASGMRGAAWSLAPLALWATGVTGFFEKLVFDPLRWAGALLAALAVVLYLTSGVMLRRREGAAAGGGEDAVEAAGESAGRKRAKGAKRAPEVGSGGSGDADLADIEALLRKRGIS